MTEDPTPPRFDPSKLPGVHIVVHGEPLGGRAMLDQSEELFPSLQNERGRKLLDRMRLSIEDRFKDGNTAIIRDGKLHLYRTCGMHLAQAWEEMPQTLLSEADIVTLSSHVYAEIKYLTLWESGKWIEHNSQFACINEHTSPYVDQQNRLLSGYLYEGLGALKTLFAEEARRNCAFKSSDPRALPETRDYPAGSFRPGEQVATYKSWQQGFCIALRRFGEDFLADDEARAILQQFVRDLRFMEDYTSSLKATPRAVLKHYREFAQMWDKFYVPLRYWKKAAACRFMERMFGYVSTEAEFSRSFYKQGGDAKNNRAPGLNGLVPRSPEVVTKWETFNTPVVTVSALAADRHGLETGRCREALERCLGVKVRVK